MDTNIASCVPEKLSKSKKHDKPPWMNKSARKQIRRKQCAWNRYQSSTNYKAYLAYVKCRDKTTSKLRKLKKEYERKIANECKRNPKAFYKYVNFKSKGNKKIIRLKDDAGRVSLSDEVNANILNDFFTSVFTNESDSQELIYNESINQLWGIEAAEPFQFNGKPTNVILDSISLDKETVARLLCEIDPTKSSTPECIHPRILKECGIYGILSEMERG